MRTRTRVACSVALLGSALLPRAGSSQTPPAPAPVAAAATASASQGAGAAPPPAPTGFLEQAEATGDWGGVRTRWKDKGATVDSSLTQFYQGVASGGADQGSEYNATAHARLEFDFGKLAGWNFWSAEIKAEWRFGGPLLTGTGSINPTNTAAMIPASDGSVFSLTAVNLTRLFPINLKEGKLIALSFGRYNILDLLDEELFAGGGTERFMNIAQIGPLTVLRQVPLITNGVSFGYIKGGEPFFTFALLDPNDHSLDAGLSDLFADGVTFSPGLIFPVQYGRKSAQPQAGKDAPKFTDAEMKIIGAPLDFVGINVYIPSQLVVASAQPPGYQEVPFNVSHPKMFSSWHRLAPESQYWCTRFLHSLWKPREIYITENGCAASDSVAADGNVYDSDRLMYLRNGMMWQQRATAEGIPLKGSFYWSAMDNLEWTAGFGTRFGLVYVDFKTQKHTPKLSAQWYREAARRNAVV